MKLELFGVSKSFLKQSGDPIWVLKDVNLEVPECKSLMLIGPSGGGKSTLLKVIGGLLIPDTGEVYVNGKLVPKEESALLQYRKSIGTVFQSWSLFPHLTALENISLPLCRVHELSLAESHQRAFELLSRFGLQDHADQTPAELSGGQRQRVAIIRAVAIHPKLLLFDEPTSALDPVMTSEVLDLIVELKNEGSDFILVSHHINFAKKIADYIVFVSEGKVVEASPSSSFFENPQQEESRAFLNKVLKY